MRTALAIWSKVVRSDVLDGLSPEGVFRGVDVIEHENPVADSAPKFVVRSRGGAPCGVFICSPAIAPSSVHDAVEIARRAKDALGSELGRVVLEPTATGELCGRSYAVMPWRRPLSANRLAWAAQRVLLRRHLLAWVRGAVASTLRVPSDGGAGFEVALVQAIDDPTLPPVVREAARRGAERLAAGRWVPRHALAHNDLWRGNILLEDGPAWASAMAGRFVFIDWGAARISGYPLYDMARVAATLRAPRRDVREEIEAFCALAGCDRIDAGSYLAAAIGHIGRNLGYCARERYLAVARECFQVVESAMG